jgi:hypothetical protein
MNPAPTVAGILGARLRSAPFVLGARKLNESAKGTVEQVRVSGVERRAGPLGQGRTVTTPSVSRTSGAEITMLPPPTGDSSIVISARLLRHTGRILLCQSTAL